MLHLTISELTMGILVPFQCEYVHCTSENSCQLSLDGQACEEIIDNFHVEQQLERS